MPVIDQKSIFGHIINHPLFLLITGVAFIIAAIIIAGIFGDFVVPYLGHSAWFDFSMNALTAALAIVFYWLFVRFVERKSFTDFGSKGAGKEWLVGAAIGVGAMALTIGAIALMGGYRVTGFNAPNVLIGMGGIAISSGVVEEILMRGLLFRFVEQWLGSWVALAFSAILFGALHLGNPNATTLAGVAIALEAGILLAAIYMVTRRLWAAIGLHMAWNFTQGGIFGVAVSGFNEPGLLRNQMQGSDLLTGGAFGAEASLPAILICTAIGLYCLMRAIRSGRLVAPSWQRFKTGQA
ncbi:MAG: CPBP family intramembrane glutamic endopeptidase [Pseudomonadota bacterium]